VADAAEDCPDLVVPATLQSLPDLAQWVADLARRFQLSPATVYRVDLALSELITNLIAYGYPDGRPGMVSLHCWQHSERLRIRIVDDGAAFDPTTYVPPDLPGSLEAATEGGRGLRLVRHFSDELQYTRLDAGNQLTLAFDT
jgi:anti-sigma regulatory factor (Ser/Thr protein kinase)